MTSKSHSCKDNYLHVLQISYMILICNSKKAINAGWFYQANEIDNTKSHCTTSATKSQIKCLKSKSPIHLLRQNLPISNIIIWIEVFHFWESWLENSTTRRKITIKFSKSTQRNQNYRVFRKHKCNAPESRKNAALCFDFQFSLPPNEKPTEISKGYFNTCFECS